MIKLQYLVKPYNCIYNTMCTHMNNFMHYIISGYQSSRKGMQGFSGSGQGTYGMGLKSP